MIVNINLDEIEKWINEAWEKVAKEINKSRWVQWTEAAAITYPLYHHLERLGGKHNINLEIAVVPQFRFTIPGHAECGDKKHYEGYERKKGERDVNYDLAIVRFEEPIPTADESQERPYCSLWCFKPRPLVLFEAKYVEDLKSKDFVEGFAKDFKKLEKAFDWTNNSLQRAYLCIVYMESEGGLSKEIVPRSSEPKLDRIRVAEIVCEKKDGHYRPYIQPYKEWCKIHFGGE
ncbi:MAG: hypothetical protein KKI07_03945 [Euryarchaeota archaeon]|nr:hypothetical protein [Euryarchaeota archaeon]